MKTNVEEITIVPDKMEKSGLWLHPKTRNIAMSVITPEKGECMIINGQQEQEYHSIHSFTWAPDGQSWAYVAWDGTQTILVRDDVVDKQYVDIGLYTPHWSDDSRSLAFSYKKDGKYFVAVNNISFGPFDSQIPGTGRYYSPLVFRPGTSEIAYAANRGGRYALEISGNRDNEYEVVVDPLFSQDGSCWAVEVRQHNQKSVVWNGKQCNWYKNVDQITLSADGKQLAFIAEENNENFVVINNKRQPVFKYIGQLQYSCGLNEFAYSATSKGQTRTIIPGKEGPQYNEGLTDLVFSPDGEHFAYVAHTREIINDIPCNSMMLATIDHHIVGKHKKILYGTEGAIRLDVTGKILAYLLYPDAEEGMAVAINGEIGKTFDGVYGSHTYGTLYFDARSAVSFTAMLNDKVYWVTQSID